MRGRGHFGHHHHGGGRIIMMQIPPMTDQCIVFMFNQLTKSFDTYQYSAMQTQGRASEQAVTAVLNDLTTCAQQNSPNVGAMQCFFILFFFMIFGCIGAMPAVIISNSDATDFNPGMIIGPMMALFIILIVVMVTCTRKVNLAMMKKYQEMQAKAREILERHKTQFEPVGLRWAVPTSFPRWVELWKDYAAVGAPMNQVPINQVSLDPSQALFGNNYGQPYQGFQQPGFQQPGFQQPGFQQPGFQQAGYQNYGQQAGFYGQPQQGYNQGGLR